MSESLTPSPEPPSDSELAQTTEVISHLLDRKISRRHVLQLIGLGAAGVAAGSAIRVVTNETGTWKSHAHSKQYLMDRAHLHHKPFQFGSYVEERGDLWAIPNYLRETTLYEHKLGVFCNLEWADSERHPGKFRDFLRLLHQINQRGSEAVISIHVGERPHGLHPLHPVNREWIHTLIDLFMRGIDEGYQHPTEIRWLYEMNIPKAFEYGRDKGLSDQAQERGFRETAIYFAQQRDRSPFERKIAFCPSTWHDFANYYVPVQDGWRVFDTAGLDGYDIFPGSLAGLLGAEVSLETRLQLLGYYFLLGSRSPEQVFESAMIQLNHLTGEEIPRYIYEMGTKTGDPEWLDHAVWLAAAMGFDGAVPFTMNKEYQVAHLEKPYESDWGQHAINAAPLWANTLHVLNSRTTVP